MVEDTPSKFFISLPSDCGSAPYKYVVIEATTEEVAWRGDARLTVVAPEGYPWPSVRQHGLVQWVETEGPARYLTRQEWLEIVQEELAL